VSAVEAPVVAGAPVATPAKAPRRRERRPRSALLLGGFTWLVILYTLIPIIVVIIFSFNQTPSGRVTFHWYGATTQWYVHIFEISDLTTALVHSFEVACASTLISVLIGVPMAMALARHRFFGRTAVESVVFVDIAAPSVVVGASLLALFLTLNVTRGLATIMIAHVAFNVAFVVVVVRARIVGLDRSIERAAADLGAGPWTTFRKVLLPLMFPGIVAAALLCFAMSIDDFIITQFVAGQTLTFPLWVYGAVKVGIPPQVFAMGTLIFLLGAVLAICNVFFQRRAEKAAAPIQVAEPQPITTVL
jgi:spermidine/putrescine transport system permease protein